MDEFLRVHERHIVGVVNGFDRLVLRGRVRRLSFVEGMMAYLWSCQVLLKDFGAFARAQSERLRAASLALAGSLDRPILYLASPRISKEDTARAIAERDGIREGLVCVLKAVEAAPSFDVHRNRNRRRLELAVRSRQGLCLYHYWIDPLFGFMNARQQTWFPFAIQVCLNGREWLARQLDAAGIGYERRDNCFVQIADLARAQALLDQQLKTDWPAQLAAIVERLNPAHAALLPPGFGNYYWTVHQSEWASDVMFRTPEALAAIYPPLVRSGIAAFGSKDVLRFLGRAPHPRLAGEVTSSYRQRPEGVRLKHSVAGNSVKVYDKQGSVLRIETTINNAHGFKVYRPRDGEREDQPDRQDWRPMRKGIADLYRRAQVSQAANDRYAAALASVEIKRRLGEVAAAICSPVRHNGLRCRAVRPFAPDDHALLSAVADGAFAVNGLRNRDLLAKLFPGAHRPDQRRRLAGRVSRKLRLLRAHGILRKVPRTHRYLVTSRGREILTAFLHAHDAPITELVKMAA